VVSLQYITTVTDATDRHGMWNSTQLIPIDEYIRATNPYTLFHKYFLTSEDHVPIQLPSVRL
jgi:hypothetical protein